MYSRNYAEEGNVTEPTDDDAFLEDIAVNYGRQLQEAINDRSSAIHGLGELEAVHRLLKKQAMSALKNKKNEESLENQLSNDIDLRYENIRGVFQAQVTTATEEASASHRDESSKSNTWQQRLTRPMEAIKQVMRPSKPHALHAIVPSTSKKNTYELKSEVFEDRIWKEVESLPVVVISIAGMFRTGKSFILGYLIRYLESLERNRETDNWMGDPNDPLRGFSWKYGRKKHTSGISIWNKIFKLHTPSGTISVVLMDTEGTGDNTSTIGSNTTLFSLSMLLSSTLMYNVRGNISQTLVQNLEFCAKYANMLKTMESEGKREGSDSFQKLLFLVRDWDAVAEIKPGLDVEQKLVREWLHHDVEAEDSVNRMRKSVRENIPDIDSFLMPHPGSCVTRVDFDGRSGDLSPSFKEALDGLVRYIFSPENLVPMSLNGTQITCKDFTAMFKAYFRNCKSGKLPEVRSLCDVTAFIHNNNVVKRIQEEYVLAIRKEIPEPMELEAPLEALEAAHCRVKKECIENLDNAPIMGSYIESIREQLSQTLDAFHETNCMSLSQQLGTKKMEEALAKREQEVKATQQEMENADTVNRIKRKHEEALNQALQKIRESNGGECALESEHKKLKQESLCELRKADLKGGNIERLEEQLCKMIDSNYAAISSLLRRYIVEDQLKELVAQREAENKADKEQWELRTQKLGDDIREKEQQLKIYAEQIWRFPAWHEF